MLVASLSILAVGRLLGVPELTVAGSTGITLIVIGAIWIYIRQVNIDVARIVSPNRIHAGSSINITLEISNRSRSSTPLLQSFDELKSLFGQLGVSQLSIPPISGGGRALNTYSYTCNQRGPIKIGPLKIKMRDPFGLVNRVVYESTETDLVVWPAVVYLAAPNMAGSNDDTFSASTSRQIGGNDHVGLRPYQIGDDLRHIHWRASARHDDLIMRQLETPLNNATIIILDKRATSYTRTSFERAVESVASIVSAFANEDRALRLLISSNSNNSEIFDSGIGRGRRFGESLLDELASVEPDPTVDGKAMLVGLNERLIRNKSYELSPVILVGGDPRDLTPLTNSIQTSTSAVMSVAFISGRYDQTSLIPNLMVVNEADSFQKIWQSNIGALS